MKCVLACILFLVSFIRGQSQTETSKLFNKRWLVVYSQFNGDEKQYLPPGEMSFYFADKDSYAEENGVKAKMIVNYDPVAKQLKLTGMNGNGGAALFTVAKVTEHSLQLVITEGSDKETLFLRSSELPFKTTINTLDDVQWNLSLQGAALKVLLAEMGLKKKEQNKNGLEHYTYHVDSENTFSIAYKGAELAGFHISFPKQSDAYGFEEKIKNTAGYRKITSENNAGCGYQIYSNGKNIVRFIGKSMWVTNAEVLKKDKVFVEFLGVDCD